MQAYGWKTVRCFFVAMLVVCMSGAAMALPAEGEQAAAAKVQGTVNINTATMKELKLLPGVGKKTAENIISHREQQGRFATVDELLKVQGIGKKTMEKIRPYCTVEGETTIAKVKK